MGLSCHRCDPIKRIQKGHSVNRSILTILALAGSVIVSSAIAAEIDTPTKTVPPANAITPASGGMMAAHASTSGGMMAAHGGKPLKKHKGSATSAAMMSAHPMAAAGSMAPADSMVGAH
jgi:hypothetical protein